MWWGGDSGEGTEHRKLWRYKRNPASTNSRFSLAVGGTVAFDKAGEVNWESQLEEGIVYCSKSMNLVSDVKETSQWITQTT